MFICLTEKGWAWLAEHVNDDLPDPRTNMKEVLERVLTRLKNFLDAKQLSLAEFISPSRRRDSNEPEDIGRRIEEAYYQLSGGQLNVRVRLADLRSRLADIPRQHLDEALLALERKGRAALYRLDDPREIRPQDREGVLITPFGDERHIIYLGGSPS